MLKKKFSWLVIAFMAIITMPFLTSCSDDEPSSGDIVGTWKSNTPLYEAFDMVSYIQFRKDGSLVEVDINEYVNDVDIMYGNWTRKGDKLTLSGSGLNTTSATIKKLTKTDLVVEVLSLEVSYKKVSDSEIEEYLED